ncbi:GNAT family N-acetyltransferase [Streptomyces sp. NPDC048340]|uniref:GNAT family N-acetyltransferase n=1 Tax=Streptomyces sp. NPDC048340 TaxID=3365537 RepID=UPI00370FE3F5
MRGAPRYPLRSRHGRPRPRALAQDGPYDFRVGDALVGCTTVRPPADDPTAATVIARVLPGHRGRGLGGALYAHGLEQARALGATVIETVVLASNTEGLHFARRRGFAEVDRYVLPGHTVAFVDLRLEQHHG